MASRRPKRKRSKRPQRPAREPAVYRVEFKRSAAKDLASVPLDDRQLIGRLIDSLRTNPRPQGVEKLSGGDKLYRVRAGSYRVVYTIEDDVLLVLVVAIGHRRDIYRVAKRRK